MTKLCNSGHATKVLLIKSCNVSCTVWQYGLWSFQMGGTKLERFLPNNQHNLLMGRCQKVGIILESKEIWKLMLSKNVNKQNVLLNWYSSMKKNLEKDSDNFWNRKLTPPHQPNSQNSIISFEYVPILILRQNSF